MKLIHLIPLFWALVPVSALGQAPTPPPTPPLALTGVSVFDGTGAGLLSDATIVIVDGRIASIGPRQRASIPPRTREIDLRGKFVIPGLINTNIHLTPYNSFESFPGPDSLFTANALEGARTLLEHGITTVLDSYGLLPPLLAARDRLESGAAEGASVLVAGNIIGWGGPWSYSFSGSTGGQPANLRALRDEFVQGVGENLIDLPPDSLRVLLGRYIDRGVDFVKLGVTTHTANPAYLLFSSRALAAMVDTAHARGRKVQVHAGTVEGLWMATLAGVDLLQHPEVLGLPLPGVLIDSIRARGVVCSMMPARITGAEWKRFQEHLALGGRIWPPEKPPAMMQADFDSLKKTGIDPTRRPLTASVIRFQNQRANAEALIRSGCTVSVATDELVGVPGTPSPVRIGDAFYAALEGLVELGMTPARALIAATRNGAIASGLQNEIGTIAVGKRADLVVLDDNPLTDIRNVRRVTMVIHRGRVLDR